MSLTVHPLDLGTLNVDKSGLTLRRGPLPGHTPGLQGVLVKTLNGRVMIASDHCPLYENFDSLVPTGIIHDLEAWYASTARIKDLADRKSVV